MQKQLKFIIKKITTMKRIFKGLLATAVVVFLAGYGISKIMNNNAQLSATTLANIEAISQDENAGSKGTLYGDASGTRYCCCPGSNNCAASSCPNRICR